MNKLNKFRAEKLKAEAEKLAKRDQLLGFIFRENQNTMREITRSRERIREMKEEAGYPNHCSFDLVWKRVLEESGEFKKALVEGRIKESTDE